MRVAPLLRRLQASMWGICFQEWLYGAPCLLREVSEDELQACF